VLAQVATQLPMASQRVATVDLLSAPLRLKASLALLLVARLQQPLMQVVTMPQVVAVTAATPQLPMASETVLCWKVPEAQRKALLAHRASPGLTQASLNERLLLHGMLAV